MKKIILISIVLLLGIFVFAGIQHHWFSTFEVEITPDFSHSEIEKVKEDMKSRGMVLEIDHLKYDEIGKIREISGNTVFSNGNSISFNSMKLKKILITKGWFSCCGVSVQSNS